MKVRLAGVLRAVAALAIAGVFAAPLRGQAVPATTTATTGAQQTGAGQPASDLVPVIVLFTGEGDWAFVGSTGGGSFGSGGQGNGGGVSIPSVASAPPNSVPTPARAQALQPTRRVTNTAILAARPVRTPTIFPAAKPVQPVAVPAAPPKAATADKR